MLAVAAPERIQFPVFASPKIDGIRAFVKDDLLLSRKMKPIPNDYVQDTLAIHELDGLDGELTVGPPNAQNCMQVSMSGVMTEQGQPEFTWWVFDFWNCPSMPYIDRWQALKECLNVEKFPRIKLLQQVLIENAEQLAAYEEVTVNEGYEGVMLRSLSSPYKYGRSTAREGYLLKVKRWQDSEAVVIGFEEKMHNANEATVDERGYTKRSSHQENLVPMGVLGALLVRNTNGVEFSIGTGFDDVNRKMIWDLRSSYLGANVTYKHFAVTGVKDKPRFPVFKCFRDPRDMS